MMDSIASIDCSSVPQNCHLCSTGWAINLSWKYLKSQSVKFNFYFAKPINEILTNTRTSQVIMLKDLQYMDTENEYLRDFYKNSKPALRDVVKRYLPVFRPKICLGQYTQTIDKRYRRLEKLMFRPHTSRQVSMILNSEDDPNRLQKVLNISFDDSEHNIYEEEGSKPQQYIDLKFDPEDVKELWDYDDLDDFDEMANLINQKETARLKQKIKFNDQGNTTMKVLAPRVSLQIQTFEDENQTYPKPPQSKRHTPLNNLNQLMNQFSKRTPQSGLQTERQKKSQIEYSLHPPKGSSVSPNPQLFAHRKSAGVQTPASASKKPKKYIFPQHGREKDNLLSVLKYFNESEPQSPSRRIEIKMSLNKLIQEQSNPERDKAIYPSNGFWTSRNQLISNSSKKQPFFSRKP